MSQHPHRKLERGRKSAQVGKQPFNQPLNKKKSEQSILIFFFLFYKYIYIYILLYTSVRKCVWGGGLYIFLLRVDIWSDGLIFRGKYFFLYVKEWLVHLFPKRIKLQLECLLQCLNLYRPRVEYYEIIKMSDKHFFFLWHFSAAFFTKPWFISDPAVGYTVIPYGVSKHIICLIWCDMMIVVIGRCCRQWPGETNTKSTHSQEADQVTNNKNLPLLSPNSLLRSEIMVPLVNKY